MIEQKKRRNWTVLLSIILAFFFGIYFQPEYKVTPSEIRQLQSEVEAKKIPPELTADLLLFAEQEVGNDATGKEEFLETLQAYMARPDKKAEQYMLKICRYNPPVSIAQTIGNLYLQILLILSLPFLFFSVTFGIIQAGSASAAGRIHLKMLVYAFGSTSAALIIGIVFAQWIFPADPILSDIAGLNEITDYTAHQFDSLFYNPFSLEFIFGIFENYWVLMLIVAGVVGIFSLKLNTRNRSTLSDFFRANFELMRKITDFVMLLAPIGIFGLLTPVASEVQLNLQNIDSQVISIFTGIISALFFYAFVFLPILLYFASKKNPFQFFKEQLTPILTAFATADFKTALAPAVTVMKENGKIPDKEIAGPLSLSMIINVGGTALLGAMAVIFMAHTHRFNPELEELLIVAVITLLISMTGAGVLPFPALIITAILVKVINLPMEGIAFLLPAERLLQMFASATDLWSSNCGILIVASSES